MSDVWQPEFREYGKQDNVAYIRTVRKRREYDKNILLKGRHRFRDPHGVNNTSTSKDLFPVILRLTGSDGASKGINRFLFKCLVFGPLFGPRLLTDRPKKARRTSSTDCGVQTHFGGPRLINLEILDSSQQGRTYEMVLKARA